MKPIARITALLMLLAGLLLMPLTSAAGDPADTGGSSSSGDGTTGGGTTGGGTTGGGTTGGGGATGGDPGTQGPAGTSVPRVMVEGFTVEPQTVFAGQEFTVNFSLRNTSKSTQVQNMLVTVSSPDSAFLPLGGSSSLFISRIRAERVSGQTMTFRALPSLEAKPYPLTIAVQYEDTQANAFESTETVAIEVNQELRANASAPLVTPAMLNIGQQASMTFSIQNQGKSKLFNAKASIPEGQALAPAEAFIGSIDPGASGAVDLTVTANEAASGPVDVVISYEDVTGKAFTMTRQVELNITEAQPEPEYPGGQEPEPEPAGFPWLPVIAGATLLVLLLTTLLIVRAARKRRAAREDAESLAALSGNNLIGDDWQ